MIERPSARLILLDPQDRLFLFKVHQPSVYDPADPFRDPLTGEDMRNDTVVTVLAAISIDPVPAPPPATTEPAATPAVATAHP